MYVLVSFFCLVGHFILHCALMKYNHVLHIYANFLLINVTLQQIFACFRQIFDVLGKSLLMFKLISVFTPILSLKMISIDSTSKCDTAT